MTIEKVTYVHKLVSNVSAGTGKIMCRGVLEIVLLTHLVTKKNTVTSTRKVYLV